MKRLFTILFTFMLVIPSIAQESQPRPRRFARPRFDSISPDVHDPVIATCDGRYYVFSTGFGIQCISSGDGRVWKPESPVLSQPPQWAVDEIRGYRGHTWAPDICYFCGKWYLFYSCSSFGKNTSAIGVAANSTLNTASENFAWKDLGKVVESHHNDKFNAIDPNFFVDAKGHAWLTWGSFWDGVQLAPLRVDTSAICPFSLAKKPITIARRHAKRDKVTAEEQQLSQEAPDAGPNAIEAPFVYYHQGYYYLFVSWDYCCKGPRSNYKLVVGRSVAPQGPYLDREGRNMAAGGGTILMQPDSLCYGVGHCGILISDQQIGRSADSTLLVVHAYSKAHGGNSKLWLRKLSFDAAGWPKVD